ncbi:hypothetical protein EMN47_02310 [Prolixibacteraceae bacterium JC049]|nr:hypothetical protein [Prolixibacteraceae bacterium JC049]
MRIRILLLLCLISSALGAQNVYHTGLMFKTSPVPKEERTSLNLTPSKPIKVRSRFTLRFDMSLYNADHFGYVFRIFSDNTLYDFIYTPPQKRVAYLKLVVNQKLTDIQIPIHENRIVKNSWHKIQLTSNQQTGIIKLEYDNTQYTITQPEIRYTKKFNVVFGACTTAPYVSTEVPAMAIRNIRILDHEGKISSNWLLDESKGEFARDLAGGELAKVENPIWMINDHYFWRLKQSFKTDGYADFVKEKNNSNLSVIGKNKRHVYNITKDAITEQYYNNENPLAKDYNRCVLDRNNSTLFSFGGSSNEIGEYDISTNSWTKTSAKSKNKPVNNSTLFSTPITKDLFAFGGYSDYAYSNKLFRYNAESKTWSQRALMGDFIPPRHYASIASCDNDSCFFLFGGYGNNSGQQELGSKCLFDLYHINPISGKVKQVWSDKQSTENFIPTAQAISDEKEESLYSLSFHPFLNSTLLRLFKVSLNAPSYTIVSDTLHFSFDDNKSRARLFFNNETQEFVAAVSKRLPNDSTQVNLYTLTYPPISEKNITASYESVLTNPDKFPKYIYYVVIGLLLLTTWLFFWFLRRVVRSDSGKAKTHKVNEHFFIDDSENYTKEELKKATASPKANYLQLLGEFRALDRDGNDITKLFTPKIQQLFLFILVNNIDRKTGVPSKLIDQTIWPYHTPQSAKNNRSVNIKKLRTVLEKIDGISLDYVEPLWQVTFEKSSLCDLIFILKRISKSGKKLKYSSLEKRLSRISKGVMAPVIQEEWYEKFANQVTTQMHEYLFDSIDRIGIKSHPAVTRRLARTILKLESLNEEAIKVFILSLIRLKKHSQAHNEFDLFCRDYEKLYGEPYGKSFKEFIQN